MNLWIDWIEVKYFSVSVSVTRWESKVPEDLLDSVQIENWSKKAADDDDELDRSLPIESSSDTDINTAPSTPSNPSPSLWCFERFKAFESFMPEQECK